MIPILDAILQSRLIDTLKEINLEGVIWDCRLSKIKLFHLFLRAPLNLKIKHDDGALNVLDLSGGFADEHGLAILEGYSSSENSGIIKTLDISENVQWFQSA